MRALKSQQSSKRIDEYLNTFMLMQLVLHQKRDSWTLNVLRKYYAHHFNQYHRS